MLFARTWFQLAINSSMKTTFGTPEISATFLYYNLLLETASTASFMQDSSNELRVVVLGQYLIFIIQYAETYIENNLKFQHIKIAKLIILDRKIKTKWQDLITSTGYRIKGTCILTKFLKIQAKFAKKDFYQTFTTYLSQLHMNLF